MSDTKPFILFILGGPGSGKGTQCSRLVKDFQFVHLSAGDLLREEMAREGSEYSELISTYIKEGNVVPVEITLALLKAAMDRTPDRPFLIDGYPRELGQATEFEKQISPCRAVFYFNCSEETMRARLLSRGLSSGRTDDNEETIVKRFVTFRETSYPVIEHYQERELVVEISTEDTPDNVYQLTHKAVAKLLSDETLVPKLALADSENLKASNEAQEELPEVETANQDSAKTLTSTLDTKPTVTSVASELPEESASTHSKNISKRDSAIPEEVVHYEEDGAPVHPAHETQFETSLHEAVAEPTPLEPSELKSESLLEAVNSTDHVDDDLLHSENTPFESQLEEEASKENDEAVPQSVDASLKPSESHDSPVVDPIIIKSIPEQEGLSTDIKPASDKFALATPIVLPTNSSEVETVSDIHEPEPSLAETTETKPESVLVEPETLPTEPTDSNIEPVLLLPAASLEESTKAESIKIEPETSTEEPSQAESIKLEPEAPAEEPTKAESIKIEPETSTKEPTKAESIKSEPEVPTEEPTKAESIKLEPETSTKEPSKAESIKLEPEAATEELIKAESIKLEPEASTEEPAKPESDLVGAEEFAQANFNSKQAELELLPKEITESEVKPESPEATKLELLPLELNVAKDEPEKPKSENLETSTPVPSSSNVEEASNLDINPVAPTVEEFDPMSVSKHFNEPIDIPEHAEEISHAVSKEASNPNELKPSHEDLHDSTVSAEISGQDSSNVLDDSQAVSEQTTAISPDHVETSQPDVEKVANVHHVDSIVSEKASTGDDLGSFANEIQFSDSKDLETIADLPDFTGTLSKKSILENFNSEIPDDSLPKSQPELNLLSHAEEKQEAIPEIVEDSSNEVGKTAELEESSIQKAVDDVVELNDSIPQPEEIRVSQLTDASPVSVVAPRRTSSVLGQVEPKVVLDTPLPPARTVSLPSSQASPEASAVPNTDTDKVPELQPPMPSLAKEEHAKVEVPSSSLPTPSHSEVNQSTDASLATPDITSPELPVPAKLVSEKLTDLPTAPTPDDTSSPSAPTSDPNVKTHKKKPTCVMM